MRHPEVPGQRGGHCEGRNWSLNIPFPRFALLWRGCWVPQIFICRVGARWQSRLLGSWAGSVGGRPWPRGSSGCMWVLAVSLGAPAVLGCVPHAVTSSASGASCALLRKVLEGGREVVDVEIALDSLCGGVQVSTAPHFGLAAPPSAPTAGEAAGAPPEVQARPERAPPVNS